VAFSLPELVRRGAEHRPDAPALEFDGQELSYGALWDRVNGVAQVLRERGLRRGDRVAILMSRSFDSYAGILGSMLAGGVYVPLNVAAPLAQVADIVDQCDAEHLLVDAERGADLEQLGAASKRLKFVLGTSPTKRWPEALNWKDAPTSPRGLGRSFELNEQDPCLIFFTSGSTGRPKGVVHPHRSMIANVEWAIECFQLGPEDRFTNVTSHHFDLCWLEMYASLGAQGTIIIAPERLVPFGEQLAGFYERARPTVWCSVPSVLMELSRRGRLEERDFSRLRLVLFAGERFPTKNLKALMAQLVGPEFVNMYGTTETHIAAYQPIGPLAQLSDEPLPIGRPCGHVNLAIFKPDGTRAADGETGELAIRGPSLMSGYWRLAERSAKVLQVRDVGTDLSGVFYLTGDLARVRRDGAFEIIGRGDRRVKVSGVLVDLDEVEKVLLAHPSIREVAVFQEPGEGSGPVHAVVVPKDDRAIVAPELRIHVSRHLPWQAAPQLLLVVDDLPRTGSGKISRAEIPSFAFRVRDERAGAARSPLGGRPAVREFIQRELLDGEEPSGLRNDTELIESGLVNSFGIARLVAFLETELGISLPNEDFIYENFASVSAIHDLISRLEATSGARQPADLAASAS
jgi:amino acid adenylation domain-containing protein